MMICKADFAELFPHLFLPEPAPAAHPMASAPPVECMARWEDDGGRILPASRHGQAMPGRKSQYAFDMPAFARVGAMTATMTAAVAYVTVWNMLSAHGQMTKDRGRAL